MDYTAIAEKLYPGVEGYGPCDYTPIIEHFGSVLVRDDDEDYQGDTRALICNPKTGFGYLQFGWGSCSGCDALQGASNATEIGDLIKEIGDSIQWKNQAEMLEFFERHDWQGDYSHSSRFNEQVIAYLKSYACATRLYNTYRDHCGGVLLQSRAPLPEWEALRMEYKQAWMAVAREAMK